MSEIVETIDTLARTLENVQENMRAESERHNNYFRKIMEKLDIIPGLQSDMAVMKEQMVNVKSIQELHRQNDDLIHGQQDKRFADNESSIKELEKSKWTVTGAAMAASGFITSAIEWFHK